VKRWLRWIWHGAPRPCNWSVAGYLWTTLIPLWLLTLPGCQMACAARSIHEALKDKPAPTATPEPEKPSILLRVTPQVAHAPAEVRITVLVKDPGETLSCPKFDVDFGDGCRSEAERTCPPDDPFMTGYALNLPNHKYRQGGAFTVTVRVWVDGVSVLSETAPLLMLDAPGEDESSKLASAI
jgi:hypothetical protein